MPGDDFQEKEDGFPYGSLEIARLKLRLRLSDAAVLPPFKGSTFRGLLGTSILEAWCPKAREACLGCHRAIQCPYANFFKPHLSRQGKSTPAPFVTEPAVDPRTHISRGDNLEFSLIVFGTGVKWLPFVMAAVFRAGRKGALGVRRAGFELEVPRPPANAADPHSWAAEGIEGLEIRKAWELAQGAGRIKSLRLVTPCKLKEEGRVQGELDGELIIKALERRTAGLCHFYGDGEPQRGKPEWKESPRLSTGRGRLRWVVLERRSVTQGERVSMGGWVGSLPVRECNRAAEALLRLGRWTYLGKNTVLGCGKIVVEEGA